MYVKKEKQNIFRCNTDHSYLHIMPTHWTSKGYRNVKHSLYVPKLNSKLYLWMTHFPFPLSFFHICWMSRWGFYIYDAIYSMASLNKNQLCIAPFFAEKLMDKKHWAPMTDRWWVWAKRQIVDKGEALCGSCLCLSVDCPSRGPRASVFHTGPQHEQRM